MVKILNNTQKQGIELYFDTIPQKTIINALKENNFKWHSMKKCWYTKATEQAQDFINNLQEEKINITEQNNANITAITNNYKKKEQEQTNIPQSIYKYNFKGITTPQNEYIKCTYYLDNLTYTLCLCLDTYSLLKTIPQGTTQKNNSDIYTDYFDTTNFYIEPQSKEFLSALQGYIKSLEHSEKINARYYAKHKNAYRTITQEEENKRKEQALKLINKAKELATNYLKLDFEQANNIYNTIVNENIKAHKEQEEKEQKEQNIAHIKHLQEEKIALENGKYCYYDEILENANYIIAIQKNEHYIIDFTPNCLDKKHIEYNIQICNKNTFERTFKVVKTQEEKDNIIKEYIKD